MRDKLYDTPADHIVNFAFNDDVVQVFPDMIRRSVIGYETIIPTTGLIAARHVKNGGVIYDLGCSLGATGKAIAHQSSATDLRVIGVDNSAAMIEQAQQLNDDERLTFQLGDVREIDVSGANVVIFNFVLQFIPPEQRLGLLQSIRAQMSPDGLLIVSEKVHADNSTTDAFFDTTHQAWKRANGYSDLEVAQKRQALENVMIIDREADHFERFSKAGFSRTVQWYRCLNWASFLVYP